MAKANDKVEVWRDGPVANVYLNRPKVHNSFDGETIEALTDAFRTLAEDDAARVIVLGGRGKSFCAGADLKWMIAMGAGQGATNASAAQVMAGLFDTINESPKPVIGRIHGAVRGGGVGIVACCDIPVAAHAATFAFTEVRLGIAPAVISPYVIARIGIPAARELFMTGAKFGAERAQQLGLVHYAHEGEEALDAAISELCAVLVKGGPNALAECKRLAMTVMDLPTDQRLEQTAALIARLRASPEGQEGMKSFVERRPAAWVKASQEG